MSDTSGSSHPGHRVTTEMLQTALAALDVHPVENGSTHDRAYLLGVLTAVVETTINSFDRFDLAAMNGGYSDMLATVGGGDEREVRAAWTVLLKDRVERTGLSMEETAGGEMLANVAGPALFMISNLLAMVNRRNMTQEHVTLAFTKAYEHLDESRKALDELRAHFRDAGGYSTL